MRCLTSASANRGFNRRGEGYVCLARYAARGSADAVKFFTLLPGVLKLPPQNFWNAGSPATRTLRAVRRGPMCASLAPGDARLDLKRIVLLPAKAAQLPFLLSRQTSTDLKLLWKLNCCN